jgi:hypothetical protein
VVRAVDEGHDFVLERRRAAFGCVGVVHGGPRLEPSTGHDGAAVVERGAVHHDGRVAADDVDVEELSGARGAEAKGELVGAVGVEVAGGERRIGQLARRGEGDELRYERRAGALEHPGEQLALDAGSCRRAGLLDECSQVTGHRACHRGETLLRDAVAAVPGRRSLGCALLGRAEARTVAGDLLTDRARRGGRRDRRRRRGDSGRGRRWWSGGRGRGRLAGPVPARGQAQRDRERQRAGRSPHRSSSSSAGP